MICPSCNAELEKVGKFCPYCGERLTDMIHDEKEPKEMYHDEIVEYTKINNRVNNDSRLEEDSFSTNIVEVQEIEVESNGKKEIVQIQWEQLDGYMFDPKNIEYLEERNDELLVLTKDHGLFYSPNGYVWKRITSYPEEVKVIEVIGCVDDYFTIKATGSNNFYYTKDLVSWKLVIDNSDSGDVWLPFKVNNTYFRRNYTTSDYTWIKKGFFSDKIMYDSSCKIFFYISENIDGPYTLWDKSKDIPTGYFSWNPQYFNDMYFICGHYDNDYKGNKESLFYSRDIHYCTDRTPWSELDIPLNNLSVFDDFICISVKQLCDSDVDVYCSKNGVTWKCCNSIRDKENVKIWSVQFISNILFLMLRSENMYCYISSDLNNFYKFKISSYDWHRVFMSKNGFLGVFKKNSSQDDLILLRGKVNRRDATLLDDIEGYTKKIWGGLVDALKK